MSTDIRYSISADDRFSRTFANLRRDLGAMRDSFGQLATGAAAVNSALGRIALGGLAGGAGFVAGIKSLANELDALNDSADATGSTVEQLSALEDVARRNGGTLDLVTTSIVKLNQALNAAKPGSDVENALKALGLSAAELRRDDPAVALQKLAEALNGFATDGNKARVVQELFGKSLREVAPFLKDLAEAGALNAKVTSEQADAAERFNKQLFALQTNANNAGRSLVSDMLPALNEVFERMKAMRETFGSLKGGLLAGLTSGKSFSDATEGVAFYTAEVARLQGTVDKLRTGGSVFDRINLGPREEELARARQWLQFYERTAVALKQFAGAGRGFVNPAPIEQPKLPGPPAPKAPQSEAEKYLETLQKQAENVRELTAYEKVLNDLRSNRIDGVGQKVSRDALLAAAQRVDAAQRLKAEAAQELDLRKEILRVEQLSADLIAKVADQRQAGINRALDLMAATPSGKREGIERDTEKVLDFARMFPDDERVQRQASQALQQLRKDLDDLEPKTEEVADGFTKLADSIEKSMDRATASILDFAIDGKGDFASIGRAIARDIARGLIEEPIQKEIKALGKSISDTLREALQGKDIFGELLNFIKGLGSGSGGGGGGGGMNWGSIIGWFSGLFGGTTGRALGGDVKAGQLVRWQEGGREFFVPDQNGTVVPGSQMRSAGQSITYSPVIHVNGDVSPQTVAMMRSLVAADRAQFMRQLRTGSAGV